MIPIIYLIILGILIIFSIIDLKHKQIPAIFTTGFILILLIYFGREGIFSGALAFVFSYLLLEADYFRGIADLKLLTAFGIIIPLGWGLLTYFVLFMFMGLIYKLLIIKLFKKTSEQETSFVPVVLCTYVVYLIMLVI